MDGNESISMTRILFVCHGNICRSPMAESVFAAKVRERRLEWAYTADSAAVSAEEIGNPVHPGTQRELAHHGLPEAGTVRGSSEKRITTDTTCLSAWTGRICAAWSVFSAATRCTKSRC